MNDFTNEAAKYYDLVHQPLQFFLFEAAIKLKIFDFLAKPFSADKLAADLELHPGNTSVFLDGLSAMGLLNKQNGIYQNTKITNQYFISSNPEFLGHFILRYSRWQIPNAKTLIELIKNGPPENEDEQLVSAEVWAKEAYNLASYERVLSPQIVSIISSLPEFSKMNKMLDLGGGPGIIAISIVKSHPDMNAVVFDQEEVTKVAEEFIKLENMEDRVSVKAGDLFNDSFGHEYDLIWATGILNIALDNIDEIMKKILGSLNGNGLFISLAEGLTHEKTRPKELALDRITTAFKGKEMYLDQSFISNAMLRNGFRSVHSRTINTIIGPMDLDIGRK